MHYYGMNKPAANSKEFFMFIRDKYRNFNYDTTFDLIMGDFRQGRLGKITMDIIE